ADVILAHHTAGGVRDVLHLLLGHQGAVTSRLIVDVFLRNHAARGVGNAMHDGAGYLAADGVRHRTAVFAHYIVARAKGAELLPRHPDGPAFGVAGALHLVVDNRPGAIERRAGAGVELPAARQLAALVDDRPRHVVRLDLPTAGIDHNLPLAPDRLARVGL